MKVNIFALLPVLWEKLSIFNHMTLALIFLLMLFIRMRKFPFIPNMLTLKKIMNILNIIDFNLFSFSYKVKLNCPLSNDILISQLSIHFSLYFWFIVFSLFFYKKKFLISLWVPWPMGYWLGYVSCLISNMAFFQICPKFLIYILCMSSVLCNLMRLALWPRIYLGDHSIVYSCAQNHGKDYVYSTAVGEDLIFTVFF